MTRKKDDRKSGRLLHTRLLAVAGEELTRPLLLRVGEDLFGIAFLADLPAVHEDDVVRHIPGESHLMGMIMVVFCSARPRMTRSTSPVSSGSSAEVGSSKQRISGLSARARAIATRWHWPPDSWKG